MKSIPKSYWKGFNEQQTEEFVTEIFNHYREKGFPLFPIDKKWRDNEFNKLMKYNGEILQDDVLKQTMHGLSLAWSYMPHSWNVKCNGLKTPLELFSCDETFRKVIHKRLRMGDNISDNGIRKMLKLYSGVQAVSNFRPTSASALYNHFAGSGANVLDTSSGFGGRLLGAIKAEVNYLGYEPSSASHKGLQGLIEDYSKGINAEVLKVGSEYNDFINEFDFAFTSPPYFDTEVYSNEPTQSCNKYPTKNEWRDGFLTETILRTHKSLKKGSFYCLNIQDVPNYKDLVNDSIEIGQSVGFSYKGQIKYSLSNIIFKEGKAKYNYEPVLVFLK